MAILNKPRPGLAPRILLPVLLSVGVWLLTVLLWAALRAQEERALDRAVADYASQLALMVEGRAEERLLPFERMAHRWEREGGGDEAAWRADAAEYHADHPELLAIEWVDETSRIRWVEPLEGNEAAVGLELNYEGTRAAARARSTSTGMPAMSRVIELVQGGPGVLFFHPLWRGDRLAGHLVFVARPGPLVAELMGPIDDRFEVSIYDGHNELLRQGESGQGDPASAELEVAGITWRVEARPAPQTVALYRSRTPTAVLVAGTLLGLAFCAMAYLALQSQRRREALQRQSAELQAILDLLPAMLWYKDTKNNILRANATAARGVGLTPSDMAGQPTAKIYPETAELFYQGDLEVMREGVPRLGVVEPIDTEAGRREVQTDKLPVVNAAGEVTGIIVIATDITHLKEAEALLAKHNKDLETLLYVISHDLREPLRGIRNFTDLVVKGYADRLDDRGKDMLGRIARGADRLDQLLADVLLLSRAQRAEAGSEARVDCAGVVADVLHELQSRIESTGATVTVAEHLPALRMDRFWLRQAVYNLVSNALKFTAPGQPPEIEIAPYIPAGDEQHIQGLVVSDRGPGVPPAMRDKIFGLFQRGVGRNIPGTGAGLAIVAQVAERHGGQAWVQDRPGGGSAFILTTNEK